MIHFIGVLSPGDRARGIRPSSKANMPIKGNVCEDHMDKLLTFWSLEVADWFWITKSKKAHQNIDVKELMNLGLKFNSPLVWLPRRVPRNRKMPPHKMVSFPAQPSSAGNYKTKPENKPFFLCLSKLHLHCKKWHFEPSRYIYVQLYK